jgi:hypothetical protein
LRAIDYPPNTCLLSEFDRPGFRWLLNLKHPYTALWVFSTLWALVTFLFGHVSNANGTGLMITASIVQPAIHGNWKLVYGFLGEPNFGFYFLFVAPPVIVLVYSFLLHSGNALSMLAQRGALRIADRTQNAAQAAAIPSISRTLNNSLHWLMARNPLRSLWAAKNETPDQDPIAFIRRQNKKLSFLLLIPFPILAACLGAQFLSLHNVSKGYSDNNAWEIGHVQSPYLDLWCHFFNTQLPTDKARLDILDQENNSRNVAQSLLEELTIRGLSRDPGVKSYVKFNVNDTPKTFNLQDAIKNKIVTLHATCAPHPNRRSWLQMVPFYVFVVLSQIEVALLMSLALWVAIKSLSWLTLLHSLLATGSGQSKGRYQLTPKVDDEAFRFGLGELFLPYDLLLWLVALCALYFSLQVHYESIPADPQTFSLFTRLLNLGVIAVVVLGFAFGPIFGFRKLLTPHVKDRKQQLEGKSESERAEITKKIDAQWTWPWKDPYFYLAILLLTAFVAGPLGCRIIFDILPAGAKFAIIPAQIRAWVIGVTSSIYDLFH